MLLVKLKFQKNTLITSLRGNHLHGQGEVTLDGKLGRALKLKIVAFWD